MNIERREKNGRSVKSYWLFPQSAWRSLRRQSEKASIKNYIRG